MHLKRENVVLICQKSSMYLGHRIEKVGLHPNKSKIAEILKAPVPKKLIELRAFLGLLNCYGKILPNCLGTTAQAFEKPHPMVL